jgi:hypothetical protein
LGTLITFEFNSIYFCKKHPGLFKRLFVFFLWVAVPVLLYPQQKDTMVMQKDTAVNHIVPDTINRYNLALNTLLGRDSFINSKASAVLTLAKPRVVSSRDGFFYLLTGLLLLMALIKFFFPRYFTTLFRVFFNTSLRQSQLTDQLMQAKLPSLFFNLFFICSGGAYVYFLLLRYNLVTEQHNWMIVVACIVVLGLIYLVKFSTLKFTGWVTGYTEATDTYIFVIFLISKIIGILLIPFTIFMAFSDVPVANASAVVSLVIIGFLLLLRFFRSYGLVQNQLKVSRFHFLLYIAGVEIMPLLLIYKGLLFLLSKNL